LACFFAVPIVKRAGFRASFVMGGLTYTLFVSSFVLPAYHAQNPTSSAWFADRTFIWSIVLTTGALNGVGSAVLWVANGNYISECATNANKGLFNSIFWVFLMFSAIIGYAAAAFLINDCKQTTYWFVMTVICLLATLTFMFITKPDKHPTKKAQRDLAITASGKDSILLSGGETPRDASSVASSEDEDWVQDIVDTCKMLVQARMGKLAPLWMWTAICDSTASGLFVLIMNSTIDQTPGKSDWDPNFKNK